MFGIRGIVLVTACFIIQLYVVNAIKQIEHPGFEIGKKELVFNDKSHKEGVFTLASCTTNKESKERQCNVIREKTPYSNDYRTCDVEIKLGNRKDGSDIDKDQLSIIPFGKNKALLYLVENVKNGHMQFNTINFDGCKVTTYELAVIDPTDDNDRMIIVTYDDSFDVYYLNHEVGKQYLIARFDGDGQKQDLPLGPSKAEAYSSDVMRIEPISESRNKGTIYMEHNVKDSDTEFDVMIRKPDGTNIPLGKRTIYQHIALATNDDLIGMCFKTYATHSELNCTQKDLSGEEKFNLSPLKNDSDSAVFATRNLPGGGMLIAVGSSKKPISSYHDIDISVLKIDSTGKTVGTVHIDKPEAVSDSYDVKLSLSFHTDKDQNNCISIGNYLLGSFRVRNSCLCETGCKKKCQSATATAYCFTDEDFTK